MERAGHEGHRQGAPRRAQPAGRRSERGTRRAHGVPEGLNNRRVRESMIERSPAYDSMRKLLALLCIALVVFTTIAPVASSHFSEVLAPRRSGWMRQAR